LISGAPAALAAAQLRSKPGAEKPNIVLIISDQFRADNLGVLGGNPMNLTPNLDRMAAGGVLFRSAISNQPVCAPARGSIFTGQYPSRHGVWRNGFGLQTNAATLATALTGAGYSANYIGKWHLAGRDGVPANLPHGPVFPEHRGGFRDLWEASNELELTSHAYEGDMYDGQGKPLHFDGRYRADFLTDRALRFLQSPATRSPFLLTVSYLETHHQNDRDTFDPPKEFAGRYRNPWIPPDLRALPGTWPSQLPDYYACVAKIDECVGTIRKTLAAAGLDRNTIVVFTSDHGCHFRTRNTEYKRSPHESSIRVPLIVEGPGFNRGVTIDELVSHVDYAPSLIAAAGVAVPSSMQGHNFLPLLDRKTEGWRSEVYFELSEYVTGRGLRTPQYTYAVIAPKQPGRRDGNTAEKYVEYVLYDNYADPAQQVNLAGRAPYQQVSRELRQRMLARMAEAGEAAPAIETSWFPYS
jgi:arylsulfatase A-like enzyme